MSDIHIRSHGYAGRITLTRPEALNAVTWDMIRAIDAALDAWEHDPAVRMVIIDAEGDRAFAAGGDIVDLYNTGVSGDFAFGQTFWAEEYRLNARIRGYTKPYVALMHGFVMGGGVGISCHGSHRIVDESVQIAMPECGIGLVPDVGGSWLLARVPKNLGPFIGLTGYRMGPDDAIFAGFADSFVPRAAWPDLIATLCKTGDTSAIAQAEQSPPEGNLVAWWPETGRWFRADRIATLIDDLDAVGAQNATKWSKTLRRQSPLAMECGLRLIHTAKDLTFEQALAAEYRFVYRCMEHGDFLEGIRAQVIDKDRTPNWRHPVKGVSEGEIEAMLAPLDADELTFKGEQT